MSTPAITDAAYSAIAAGRAGFESKYQWTEDNCAMCESVGPWPALDKTLHRSGDWASVVHRLLHGTVGPQRASQISVNIDAVASLAALRESMVYSDDGREANDEKHDEAVQSWADATGLLHEMELYTHVDQLEKLGESVFSAAVVTQVFHQIEAEQKDFEHRLKTLVSKAMITGELEKARSLQSEAQFRKRTVEKAKLNE